MRKFVAESDTSLTQDDDMLCRKAGTNPDSDT